uniref:EGF-like domain-containing protein n=1 Tax=Ciona savignyi TaxID=51511 RepID=H2Y5Q7_CIOSA
HNCHANATCTNNIGSFTCSCNTGFTGNGVNCSDIIECTSGTHNCHANATCTNNIGSYTCSCNTGFTGDGVNCTDINECISSTHNCSGNEQCTNTIGSFTCVIAQAAGISWWIILLVCIGSFIALVILAYFLWTKRRSENYHMPSTKPIDEKYRSINIADDDVTSPTPVNGVKTDPVKDSSTTTASDIIDIYSKINRSTADDSL